MLIHWIWLAQRKNVTIGQKLQCLDYFRDPEYVYAASSAAFRCVEGLSEKALKSLEDKDLTDAREILRKCEDKNISILTFGDGAYPHRLKNIAAPPLVLYYKGYLPQWQEMPAIGIVGTRKASAAGLKNACEFGYEVAACGGLVVSGGADGIDAAALEGAMRAGKKVVAVLGFGADIVYPAKHKALFANIEKQGCLLTEYIPGTPANSWNFPMRNRIISGISAGVLVVEAPKRSGAMNTANHAMDQGRDLFAVPGNVGVECCAGSNELLKDRAMVATCGWDVVSEYAGLYPHAVKKCSGKPQPEQKPEKLPEQIATASPFDKISIDNPEKSQYSVNANLTLSEEEQQIVAKLTKKAVPVDSLLMMLDMPAGKALSILTMLALKGVVQNHPGNSVSLK